MFSYYGSKSKIVELYPKPIHDKIIEPFAGSARYSLKWFEKDVLLIDKYEVVVRVWKYLQKATIKDILGLPKFKLGMDLRQCNLSEDELLFLGMCAGVASTQPRFKISMYAREQNGYRNRFKRIADSLYKIRHWEVREGSYESIPNEKATWFIDPPYQFGGHAYVESKIDFIHLKKWSEQRKGQVIICENTKANWMDFKPIISKKGANNSYTTEAIWSNLKTQFDIKQQTLFEYQ